MSSQINQLVDADGLTLARETRRPERANDSLVANRGQRSFADQDLT